MPTQQVIDGKPPVVESSVASSDEAPVRELAVKQIERKRHFEMRAFGAGVVAVFLVVVWAVAEYNNAGGWPTNGFSQSSGIYHVWNDWIIYPIVAIALGVAIDAWNTYRRKPISEDEIRREMDRLRGVH
ncbi:MAG TPA: 2TM domain-containing protein [Solirubrobacteraceae bacterium]|nr:2TM domain-containing protein [Solirubrobacteraceae bacterium]